MAVMDEFKEEKSAPVVPKSKSTPVAEPAPEPEDATTDGDDEVVDTGYGAQHNLYNVIQVKNHLPSIWISPNHNPLL